MGLPMPSCTQETANHKIEFGRLGRRVVQGQFDGGSMTSDAGVMLLGVTDHKLGLMQAAASCIADSRSPLWITHSVADLLRQRVYGLALGWEDLMTAAHCAATWPCRQQSTYCERYRLATKGPLPHETSG